jgi:hypothetical protein
MRGARARVLPGGHQPAGPSLLTAFRRRDAPRRADRARHGRMSKGVRTRRANGRTKRLSAWIDRSLNRAESSGSTADCRTVSRNDRRVSMKPGHRQWGHTLRSGTDDTSNHALVDAGHADPGGVGRWDSSPNSCPGRRASPRGRWQFPSFCSAPGSGSMKRPSSHWLTGSVPVSRSA